MYVRTNASVYQFYDIHEKKASIFWPTGYNQNFQYGISA